MGRVMGQGQAFGIGHALDQIRAQARHGIGGHGRVRIGAVAGVEHARGRGREHGHEQHRHGRLVVGVAGQHPVGDGLGRVLAGDHLQVGAHGHVGRDMEHAFVLAGERGPAILGHGRAAGGQLAWAAVRAPAEQPGGFGQGAGHIVRQPGGQDAATDVRGQSAQFVGPSQVHPAQEPVDGRPQLGCFQKIAKGVGGDHEAFGHRHLGVPGRPGQMGGLAAGRVRRIGHGLQGHHKGWSHAAQGDVQGHLDVEIELFGVVGQIEMAGRLQAGQAHHHFGDRVAQLVGQMDDAGPVHHRLTVVDGLQGGDQFQADLVLAQQLPKGVVLFPQQHPRGKDLIGPAAQQLPGKHASSATGRRRPGPPRPCVRVRPCQWV